MTDLRRRPAPLWRQSATPEELAAIETIEVMLAGLDAKRRELSRERARIASRCANRTLSRREAQQP